MGKPKASDVQALAERPMYTVAELLLDPAHLVKGVAAQRFFRPSRRSPEIRTPGAGRRPALDGMKIAKSNDQTPGSGQVV